MRQGFILTNQMGMSTPPPFGGSVLCPLAVMKGGVLEFLAPLVVRIVFRMNHQDWHAPQHLPFFSPMRR